MKKTKFYQCPKCGKSDTIETSNIFSLDGCDSTGSRFVAFTMKCRSCSAEFQNNLITTYAGFSYKENKNSEECDFDIFGEKLDKDFD